ncbi:phosphoribosyltransferase [Aegicerativicinus sediminis]
MFANREEAGILLSQKLINYRNNEDAVIVSVPRGGVPIGYVLHQKLNLPMELLLSKKIGHPFLKDYIIGVVSRDFTVLDPLTSAAVSGSYINNEVERLRKQLKLRYNGYYKLYKSINLKNKTVILVDEGAVTGNTLLYSIQLIQQKHPKEIIIAIPVAPISTLRKIEHLKLVKSTICLHSPNEFRTVGQFYTDFKSITDNEVFSILNKVGYKAEPRIANNN